MHIKAKLYPYPVLTDFNDDYIDSSFNMEISVKQTPNKIILCVNTVLDNDEIKLLVENKKANYCLHIECALTSYRKMISIYNDYQEIEISADNIEGIISLCPFIIANQKIKDYVNSKFNPVYENINFDLEKGNFIAIGKEVQVRIEKESDNLSSVPSIFAVTEIKDESRKDIVIDNSGNKINVQLPSKTYYEFKIATNNPNAATILHSMIIIPSLMKCFEEMKSKATVGEFFIFEDKRWFRAIKKAMLNIGIALDEESIISLDSFDIAQKLMDGTTNRAILGINDMAVQGANDE